MAVAIALKCSKALLLLVALRAADAAPKGKRKAKAARQPNQAIIHGWDESTFIQANMGLTVHVAPAVEDKCKCLNWKQLYASRWVKCGDALEGFSDTKAPGKLSAGNAQWCSGLKFFPKRDDTYCTKVSRDSAMPEQSDSFEHGSWCYVEAGCQELNGGAVVNEAVAWKSCKAGAGETLGDLKPAELAEMSKSKSIDAGLLAQMAYPVSKDKVWSKDLSLIQKSGEQVGKGPAVVCERNSKDAALGPCGSSETFVIHGAEAWRMGKQVCRVGDAGCEP